MFLTRKRLFEQNIVQLIDTRTRVSFNIDWQMKNVETLN